MKNKEKSNLKEHSFLLNLPISFKGKEDFVLRTIELNITRRRVPADFAKQSKVNAIEKNASERETRMARNKNFTAILV